MPRFSHSFHPSLASANRTFAHCTFHAKQFLVIFLAVRFSSINIEALRTDLFATVTANEVLRMKRLANSLNTGLWRATIHWASATLDWLERSNVTMSRTPLSIKINKSFTRTARKWTWKFWLIEEDDFRFKVFVLKYEPSTFSSQRENISLQLACFNRTLLSFSISKKQYWSIAR